MTMTSRTRLSALGAFALAGLLTLSACSGGDTTATTPPATGSTQATSSDLPAAQAETTSLVPPAEGAVTYPMTLETPWGSTELTKRPERIAAVTPSQDDAEILAALGVTPVIASEYATDVWLTEALAQPIPERFTPGDSKFPAEQIAKAAPDLIIVLNTDLTDDYAKLSAVAPVLAVNQEAGSEASIANDWKFNIVRIGEVLDLQDAAQRVLDEEEEFYADFRADNPDLAGLTASYVVYYGDNGGLQFHSAKASPSESVFERMGLAANPNAEQFTYRQEVSQELFSTIDADVIVFSDNSDGNYADVTEQPLFKNLKAVQDGHLILIDNRAAEGTFVIDGITYEGNLPWALARSGPLSGTWAAGKLAPALEASLGS